MRITFVVPNVPSPIRVRPYSLIKQLSAHHSISLICLITDRIEASFLPEMRRVCERVTAFRMSWPRGLVNVVGALPTNTPLRLAYFRHVGLRREVARVHRLGLADILHFEHAKTAWLASPKANTRIPQLLDAVDSVALLFERQLPRSKGFRRHFLSMELARMRQTEATGFLRFDRVLISSEADARNVASLSGGSVKPDVLPNLVDFGRFTFVTSRRIADRIIFAAKLDYAPNTEAAEYFIRSVMPLVWARRPQAEAVVVGSNPPASLAGLSRHPQVTVRGFVPDLSAEVAQASVAVAPLLVKAGTQYKILEAMAVGTPVVATELACQGLDVQHNRELLTATSADEFAINILRLLGSSELAERIRHSGRRYVERNHDAASVARRLETVYVEMLRERATNPG